MIPDEKRITMETLSKLTSDISITSLIMNNISTCGVHLGVLAEKEETLFRETLKKLFDLLLKEKIKPEIDSVWPFEQIIGATKRLQERKNVGKVLLSTQNANDE